MEKEINTNGIWRKIKIFLLGGITIFLILTAISIIPIIFAPEPGLLWALPYVMLMAVIYPPVAIAIIVISGLLSVRSANRRSVNLPWAPGGWRLFTVFILVVATMWGIVLLKEHFRFTPEQRAHSKKVHKIMFSDDISYLLSVTRESDSRLRCNALMSIGSLIHNSLYPYGKKRIVNFTPAQVAEICQVFLDAVRDPNQEIRRVALGSAGNLLKLKNPTICPGETGDTLAYLVIESMGDPVRETRSAAMVSADQALDRLGTKAEPLFHDLLAKRLQILQTSIPGDTRHPELREVLGAIKAKPELFSDQKNELDACLQSPDELVRKRAKDILSHIEAHPSKENK